MRETIKRWIEQGLISYKDDTKPKPNHLFVKKPTVRPKISVRPNSTDLSRVTGLPPHLAGKTFHKRKPTRGHNGQFARKID